jgi:hypothetical protein
MVAGLIRTLTVVMIGLGMAAPARAEPSHVTCETPAYLLASDANLIKVNTAVMKSHKLDVLVIGSVSSTISGSDGAAAAYPKRLEARLRELLPGVTVNVSTELFPKKSAEEIADIADKLVLDHHPDLVIWQTGTIDAVQSISADDFQNGVDEGLQAIQTAGADAILMNLQYSPRTENMIAATPYLDSMRVVAQQHEIPLLDRFGLMRHWSDVGEFDLFGNTRNSDMAKRVHDCLAHALADVVLDTAHINPAELRIQR